MLLFLESPACARVALELKLIIILIISVQMFERSLPENHKFTELLTSPVFVSPNV